MARKILIVDDNAINRQMLINVLEKDYDILEAQDGREALALINHSYKMLSAVLLDIMMPELDGYEVLRRVRDNVVLSPIPVIMVTGSEDEEARVKALSLGANDFIQKPFNPDIVKHCLRNNIALRETASILNAIQKDKLTGLYNREAFFERVAGMTAEREPGYYVLSCFDIDNFKLINDQYGAAEGDRILREVGKAVGKNAEEIGGVAGRISADNFAALFPVEKKDTEVLRRILDKELVHIEQQAVSFSIGRYVVNDLTLPASAIYDRAFIAKQSVKGRYDEHLAYFDDAMLEKLVRDREITGEMEAALAGCQFEAWFQPQYNHATGTLAGAEALARWRHPQKGVILPGEFVPLFEENGFVYELDKYIWRDVCRYMRKWMDDGLAPLPVSVNISRYDVFRSDLIDVLTGLVREYGIPMDMLRLEITESAFTSSPAIIVGIVKQFIALGFTVEIDDFGSGYSSLNTLKDVPAQVVKLDMRFLEGGDGSQRGGNILEAIVRMTKWLGMTVLAEGVEEQDQADFLKSIGCTYVQGYLYARPMPAQEFEELLSGVSIEEHPFVSGTDSLMFNDAFWDPKSIDSVVFNRYSGGACVYEFHNGLIELVRVTDKYIHTVFGTDMSAADAMGIDWTAHIDRKTGQSLAEAMYRSIETDAEVTGDYLFLDLPGCPHETYLRSSLRVIASTGDRYLVYCTSVNVTSQREAERRTMMVADKLQAVMDNVGCGITAVVYNGDKPEFLLQNDRYYELLGYTKEQYEEIEIFSPIYGDDRGRVLEASKRSYESGEPATIEYRAVKRDGELIWMRVSMTMTHIAGAEKPVQIGIFSDITAERQAARELLDNMPCGAALYEYDGKSLRVVHINNRYWKLVDRAPVNYGELSVATSLHPEDVDAAERELVNAISQSRDISLDIRVRHGAEGYRPFHIAGRVVPKEGGRFFINAIYTPISEEVMSIQKTLPIAMQAMMDSSAEIAFVKGADMRYISCSRKFAECAGLQDERELIGKTSASVFPAKLARQNEAVDKAVLDSGKSFVDIDILFPTKDGERHLLFSKYPLLDEDGRVLGVYGTGRDVTEAREEKTRLELLTENIPGGIAVYEGMPDELDKIKLVYFSDSFCRIFGYSRESYAKLAGEDPLSLVFPADSERMKEKILALVLNGIPMDYEYRAAVNGGATKWINVKAVMGEPNGGRLTVNAVFFDVTEQREARERLRVSEEVNRLAIQQSKSAVCRYDIAQKRLFFSPNVDPVFELSPEEENIPERAIREGRVSPETVEVYKAFYDSIRRGDETGEVIFQRRTAVGWRWVEEHFTTIFTDDGEPATAVISFEDVTESIEKDAAYKKWRQSISERKQDSYSLFHCNLSKDTVLDTAEGQLIPDERDMSIFHLSDRTRRYAERWVCAQDRERFLLITDRKSQIMRYTHGERTDSLEYREQLAGGGERWLKLTVDLLDSPYSDDVEAYLLFEDIDSAKRMELEMIERAQTDPLTGLLNRTTFAREADERIAASGPGTRHAMLMFDIDSFKLVNDVFGHITGDQTLVDIAELLRAGSRRGDLVGRLGGDEFVIFLSDIPNEEVAEKKARQVCELTRKALSAQVQISGSVGVALYPQDGRDFEELYRAADETLYYVKGIGKNNYAFCRDRRAAAD